MVAVIMCACPLGYGIRNLNDGGCIPVADVLRGRESVMSRFSPDRWAEFTQDIRYFKGVLSPSR